MFASAQTSNGIARDGGTDRPRVVVTGASGFVGTHLVSALRNANLDVVVAGRRTGSVGSDTAVVPFDLQHPERLLPEQLARVDCLYHLAARVHVMRPGPDDEAQFLHLNASATRVLAQTAARAGVRRFVYLSSVKVNGERTSDQPFTALDEPAPEDAYARSKAAAERALRDIAEQTNMEIVIVRPPLVYGPGVGANFRRLIALVDAGWPLPFAGLENRRSLVSIWNLTSLLLHVRTCEEAAGCTLLVSDGDDVSTPRLMNLIARGLGKPHARLIPMPAAALRIVGALLGRRGEVARLLDSLQVDISTAVAKLNWKPTLGLDEAVTRTVAWFKDGCHALD